MDVEVGRLDPAAGRAPVRVAMNVMPRDARHVVVRARSAELAGVERLVLPDAGAATRDPWPILGACAVSTERVRLGLITNPLTRRPEVTAGAIATLDELSGGRGFVVMSVGGAVQLAGMGVPAPAGVDRLVESLTTIRARHPAAEVWVATKGPRTIRAVAGLADGILLSGVPFALVGQVAGSVRAAGDLRVALTLHHVFDATSRLESGERLAYEVTSMREEYAAAAGVDPSLRAEVLDVLAASGAVAAGRLVPDSVLRAFYLDAPHEHGAAAARELAQRLGLDEVVLPERSFDDLDRP